MQELKFTHCITVSFTLKQVVWGNKILKHCPSGFLQRFAINLDVTWCSLMDLMSKCLPQLCFLSHWSATQDFTITLNTQPTFF